MMRRAAERNGVQSLSGLRITAKVFDALGREMETLFDGDADERRKEIMFDATHYPVGMYFYRVEGKGITETRAMTIVR